MGYKANYLAEWEPDKETVERQIRVSREIDKRIEEKKKKAKADEENTGK